MSRDKRGQNSWNTQLHPASSSPCVSGTDAYLDVKWKQKKQPTDQQSQDLSVLNKIKNKTYNIQCQDKSL